MVRCAVALFPWRISQSSPVRVMKRFSERWSSFPSLIWTGFVSMNLRRFRAFMAWLVRGAALQARISMPRSRGLRPAAEALRSRMVMAITS